MSGPKDTWSALERLQEQFRRQKEAASIGEGYDVGLVPEDSAGDMDMDSSQVPPARAALLDTPAAAGPTGFNLRGSGEAPTRPYHIKIIRSKNPKSPTGYSWSVNQVFDDGK